MRTMFGIGVDFVRKLGTTPGDFQHGSRRSVYEFELRGGASRTFDPDQHGREGSGVRQHHDRAFVADREVRGGLFEILRRRTGLPPEPWGIFSVLQ